MIRWFTAGESHGPALVAIVEGLPAGLEVDCDVINRDLARRQMGVGRGGRMKIERDRVEIISGVRFGLTTGSPIALKLENRDFANHRQAMAVAGKRPEGVAPVRIPGHADLAGLIKYGLDDIRNVSERASARETAARVAAGGLFRLFLRACGVEVQAHVIAVGTVDSSVAVHHCIREIRQALGPHDVGCVDQDACKKIEILIEQTREKGDTLGGVFEVIAEGVPPGLGSYIQWDLRADGRLAAALMSIPTVKGVEIGAGFSTGQAPGSEVMDGFVFSEDGLCSDITARTSNNAGGIEGGVTNGSPIIVRAAVKPIPTLGRPLTTVDLDTGKAVAAPTPRADVSVLEAASVIGEAALLGVLASLMVERFGGDMMDEVTRRVMDFRKRLGIS